MSHGKQFTLYTHVGGPNGWKVAILCDFLGLTYESIYLNFQEGDQKKPDHVKLNPNGRIPTIIDHKNNDFVLWESNAILQYIVDKYDTEKKLAVTEEGDKYKLLQWLFFQSSGQGPYYGQGSLVQHVPPREDPKCYREIPEGGPSCPWAYSRVFCLSKSGSLATS
ncbi:hypothetical protein QCA50_002664 [Cerrena zonata]|uniref:GST N-terminal domain-containing protein n=1 Tax=Cerrena zonata TaxID=2478898 RepID=A0AAW0GID5_9APHY